MALPRVLSRVTEIDLPAASLGVIADGDFVYVTTEASMIIKMRASDAAVEWSVNVGRTPLSLCSDGLRIWVVCYSDNRVDVLQASNGETLGAVNVGLHPEGIGFDGRYIWVCCEDSNNLYQIDALTLSIASTYGMATEPDGILCDPPFLWVAHFQSSLWKFEYLGGHMLIARNEILNGAGGSSLAHDGTNVWITNGAENSVTKVRPSDGAILGTFVVGSAPRGIVFDGDTLWIAASAPGAGKAVQVALDGTVLTAIDYLNDAPRGIAWDGKHVWLTRTNVPKISKI